ncbi:hypothetical protein [Novipirellula artificiosorum]|uniref:Uncharacterized protein n=1 Tax=Novipirellula artificiosorum TaxID=2528016 RepID=A0A5C6DJ32_9BACT|nr:hypothetical protein [Novipirellula artificiosorum]TWU34909.1 hypothetical protein Poly41_40520 [Novipirellula artificiosorum]
MSEVFPIQGSQTIELIGRAGMLDRIWSDLRGPRPKLSLVGPAYIGKSVILKALEKRALESGEYGAVLYWDFTIAPESKTAFYQEFCKRLGQAMKVSPAVSAFADYLDEPEYTALEDLFAEMKEEGHELLFIWDSFDRPLAEANLPAQLFGELREILNGQHQLITATRAPLREIARDKEVQGSPFWNLFGDQVPLRVGCFDEKDIEAAVAKSGLSLGSGAQKELSNWTGGHPVLLLSMLNGLHGTSTEVDNKAVVRAANRLCEQQADRLKMLWHDTTLSISARDGFHFLAENEPVDENQIGREDRDALIARGFASRDRTKLHCGCRLLRTHVQNAAPDAGTVSRLFGNEPSYHANIRDLLELRLSHFKVVDPSLFRLVKQAIGDIPDYAKHCLNNLTHVEDEALDLIWKHEFGPTRKIPQEIICFWTSPPCSQNKQIAAMMAGGNIVVPADRPKQLGLLQVLTGCTMHVDSKANYVSKDTYVLLNAIHQFRNRSEHTDGQSIDVGVAVSALLMCIELLGCLSREL